MIAILILALVWTGRPAGPDPCGEEPAVGQLTSVDIVEGEPVEILRRGRKEWEHAEAGALLCRGDQVRTRFRSRAGVHFDAVQVRPAADVVVGVNSRIRTIGDWSGGRNAALDVVHGVARIAVAGSGTEGDLPVRTGPSTCSSSGHDVLVNWDPFKREANYLVLQGRVSCTAADTTIVVESGRSVEIIAGKPEPVKFIVPLVRDAFSQATRLD